LGAEHHGRSGLRPHRGDALLPPSLASRHRHQLAEPPPCRVGVVHRGVARRQPFSATGAATGARGAGTRGRTARRGPRLIASPLVPGVWRAPVIVALLLLPAPVFTLAGPASAAHCTLPLRTRHAPWMIAADRLIGGLPISVSVADDPCLVYAHAGTVPRTPASNEKLLLSMALLDRFGPTYRIPTTVEGPRPTNGSAKGNLWLAGHGDPELNDAALERLARALHALGIRAVRGSVIGVTNTFTRERWAPGWEPIALQFIALPTALPFDANPGSGGFVFDPDPRAAAALTADPRPLGVRVSRAPSAGRA